MFLVQRKIRQKKVRLDYVFENQKLACCSLCRCVCPALYYKKTEILFPFALAVIIVWASLLCKNLSCIGKEMDFSWGIYLFHFSLMQILYF